MNNINEHFQVDLDTDLSINTTPLGQFYQLTGITIQFAPDGTYGGLSIQMVTPNQNPTVLAKGNYSLAVGQSYNFTITNTGSNVSLAVDDVNQISADTSYATGNQIAFDSREFSSTSSSLSYVSIVPTPEPSSVAIFGLGALAAASVLKRRMNDWKKVN
jgi:hypothetical protein